MNKNTYYIYLLFFNYLMAQVETTNPIITINEGIVFKLDEDIPFTGKLSISKDSLIIEQGLYRSGIKSGLWKQWHDNGQLKSKGIYRDNKKIQY